MWVLILAKLIVIIRHKSKINIKKLTKFVAL
jgi:hypothetical protein